MLSLGYLIICAVIQDFAHSTFNLLCLCLTETRKGRVGKWRGSAGMRPAAGEERQSLPPGAAQAGLSAQRPSRECEPGIPVQLDDFIHKQTYSKLTRLVSYRCAISLRHTTWTSRWSPSKNWATGWPTCAAWAPPRTAWPSTCSTSSHLARRAAKGSVHWRLYECLMPYMPSNFIFCCLTDWLVNLCMSSYLSRKTS